MSTKKSKKQPKNIKTPTGLPEEPQEGDEYEDIATGENHTVQSPPTDNWETPELAIVNLDCYSRGYRPVPGLALLKFFRKVN